METRIVVRHLGGLREGQVQEFPFSHFRQLTVGRDPSCEIRYDSDRDDLVSRQHARLEVKSTEPPEVEINDLNSRNGTFVNKRRISGSMRLSPGDTIQFGASGPEFQFHLEPSSNASSRPTRVADLGSALPPTRAVPAGTASFPPAASGVGRNTVETMLAQSQKRTGMWIAAAAAAVIVLIAATVFAIPAVRKLLFGQTGTGTKITSLTPKEIATANTDSVVFIEVGWKLIDTESGHQVSHIYFPNIVTDKAGKQHTFVAPAGNAWLPLFVAVGNKVEPLLSTSAESHSHAVGERATGSGFAVSSDGFILTNRHVAAGWNSIYSWSPEDRYGMLLVLTTNPTTGKFALQKLIPITSAQFPRSWIPAQAKFLLDGSFDPEALRDFPPLIAGKSLDGRNDYLDVVFAKTRLQVPGRTTRISDDADVAMVKVDLPQSVRKVELNDNYSSIQPGDPVTAMGYPGMSPTVYGAVASHDMNNATTALAIIPDPTISVGNIARVFRGHSTPSPDEEIQSLAGEGYQLTINSTGHGNSGGPVFDDHGRVVAIFTAGFSKPGDAAFTFAVPIRFGMELMGTRKVTQ